MITEVIHNKVINDGLVSYHEGIGILILKLTLIN